MFGKIGDMTDLFKKALELKQEVKKIKKELETIEIKKSNNLLQISCSGDLKIKSIKFLKDNLEEYKIEEIENELIDIINETIEEAKNLSNKKMNLITGGLNIPGLL